MEATGVVTFAWITGVLVAVVMALGAGWVRWVTGMLQAFDRRLRRIEIRLGCDPVEGD